MKRFSLPLTLVVSLLASAGNYALASNGPDSCEKLLKRACTVPEQASFAQGVPNMQVSKAFSRGHGAKDCDAFVKRSCNAQEREHFSRDIKAGAWAHGCDDLLKRSCTAAERKSFIKGQHGGMRLAAK
jgi:hypothetical protein